MKRSLVVSPFGFVFMKIIVCVDVCVCLCVCGCVRARPSVWVRARLSVCVWSCLRARVDAHEFGFACAHKGGIKYKWCA